MVSITESFPHEFSNTGKNRPDIENGEIRYPSLLYQLCLVRHSKAAFFRTVDCFWTVYFYWKLAGNTTGPFHWRLPADLYFYQFFFCPALLLPLFMSCRGSVQHGIKISFSENSKARNEMWSMPFMQYEMQYGN